MWRHAAHLSSSVGTERPLQSCANRWARLEGVETMGAMTLNTELVALGILLLAVLALALMSENMGV